MAKDWDVTLPIPPQADEAEQERLIQSAIDEKIDADLDDMLGSFG